MAEEKKTVVVVDDDPVILKVVEATVRKRGLKCVSFTSPVQALKHVLRWPPNVVITDFNMPSMNGIELLHEITDRLKSEAPPVIILSANPDESIIDSAFEAGVSDYLCKPFAPGELNVKLRRVLSTKTARHRRPSGLFEFETKTIGEFVIEREIGRGGMGVVYAVRSPRFSEPLALKTLHANNADIDAMLRFRREIDVLTGLSHPALVGFHGAGKDQGIYFYTMDLVEGESLREMLSADGPLPQKTLIPVLYIIASALQYLHDNELVHRDITPGNILIPEDGRIRLADFGLARHVYDSQLTADQDMLGTPNYMSPETIVGTPLDGRSDLFSLGMCALAGLMGETPVQAENPYAVMRGIMSSDFPSACSFEIPLELGLAIDGLLRVDVEKRTQRAADFMAAIEKFLAPEIVAKYSPKSVS